MDRRAFLKRLGIGVPVAVLAPPVVLDVLAKLPPAGLPEGTTTINIPKIASAPVLDASAGGWFIPPLWERRGLHSVSEHGDCHNPRSRSLVENDLIGDGSVVARCLTNLNG